MTGKQKRMLLRIIIAAVCYAIALLLPLEGLWKLPGFLVSYAVISWDILWKALKNIARGQVFDENFLMSIASVGALVLGEYAEAVAVMLFYQVGELFQSCAVSRSRRSISALMDIRPDYANLLTEDGPVRTSPEEVAVGARILVKPGERIPLDGTVLEGSSAIDTSALTGESMPREAQPGSEVISGCINITGTLTVETSKAYGESTVARILTLVESSSEKKAKAENFITRFARYYTPAVVLAAAALAVLPPLILGEGFGQWIYRALTFLVISCPCALVISIPLSFFGGIGGASRRGILIKGANYLEALADAEIVVFDKTGTLTKGSFAVTRVEPAGCTESELLSLAAGAEYYSSHPISQCIREAWGEEIDPASLSRTEELPGYGVKALVQGRAVAAGNEKLMASMGISCGASPAAGTVVHVALDGVYAGRLVIEDQLKPDAAGAISALKAGRVRKTVMLTGDTEAAGRKAAEALGLDEVYTGLLPADKVERVEALMKEKSPGGKLIFVGDGVNDAPVLARADVGTAMGGLGSDAAIEAADVVIMTDEPSKLPEAIRISRKTRAIVRENIVFALSVKAAVLLLGALGAVGMWAAVFADVGVCVLAVCNAVRAMK